MIAIFVGRYPCMCIMAFEFSREKKGSEKIEVQFFISNPVE
jgi:hypothetical protein